MDRFIIARVRIWCPQCGKYHDGSDYCMPPINPSTIQGSFVAGQSLSYDSPLYKRPEPDSDSIFSRSAVPDHPLLELVQDAGNNIVGVRDPSFDEIKPFSQIINNGMPFEIVGDKVIDYRGDVAGEIRPGNIIDMSPDRGFGP